LFKQPELTKPAFGLCNCPVALCLAPRASISPRLPATEQEERVLIPRCNLHPLLDVRQEGGRLARMLLVRLQEPGILSVNLPTVRTGVNRVPGHHDKVPEARERVLPDLARPRAAAPHRPEPGLVHRQEDEDAEAEGEQDERDGDGVRLVEVPDPHQEAGAVEVRVLGLAALPGDPGLEVEVAARVAEGHGATGAVCPYPWLLLALPTTLPLTLHYMEVFLEARYSSDPKS
jgi:hypothetical protein